MVMNGFSPPSRLYSETDTETDADHKRFFTHLIVNVNIAAQLLLIHSQQHL